MIRRPPRSTQSRSSAASDVYKRQLVGDAVGAARAPLDGALDVVFRHRVALRLLDGVGQRDVHVDVGAAFTGGYRDGARELREQLAALGVFLALFVFDGGPLGVPGHEA